MGRSRLQEIALEHPDSSLNRGFLFLHLEFGSLSPIASPISNFRDFFCRRFTLNCQRGVYIGSRAHRRYDGPDPGDPKGGYLDDKEKTWF